MCRVYRIGEKRRNNSCETVSEECRHIQFASNLQTPQSAKVILRKREKIKLFPQLEKIHYLPHCGGANFYVPTARLAGIFEWRWTRRCWWRRLVNKTAGLLISLSARCICAVKTCLFTDRQASADGEVKR